MSTRQPEILIVGAGPTGLTAAVELARRGLMPRIIDGDEGPTPLSKAVGISPHSLVLLEPSGVTKRLLELGIRVRRAHLHFANSQLGVIDLGVLDHRFDFLLSLPQSDTETVMISALEEFGIHVEWRKRLIWLETRGNGIEAVLNGPSGLDTISCSHVFGADGVHSAVRDVLGLSFLGYTHARTWSIADCVMADCRSIRTLRTCSFIPAGILVLPFQSASSASVSFRTRRTRWRESRALAASRASCASILSRSPSGRQPLIRGAMYFSAAMLRMFSPRSARAA